MAASESEKFNDTQGVEFKAPCSTCAGKTFHKVLASLDQNGEDHQGDFDFYWYSQYQIVRCQGCKEVTFRHVSSNSEAYEPGDDGDLEQVIFEDLYPSRIEGRKPISNENLIHAPRKLIRIYKETLSAMNNNSPVLSGIGLRAIVETVCKEKNAAGKDLFKKIDDLVDKKILTPAGALILHKIRTLGNKAAHEVQPHNAKQLSLAMNVVEHLIQDVYILPNQVQAEFGDDEA